MRTKVLLLIFAVLTACAVPAMALDPQVLERPLENWRADPFPRDDFRALCRRLNSGCGVEMLDNQDPKVASSEKLGATPTPREVLDEYVRQRPDLDWSVRDGIINIHPRQKPKSDWLSRRVVGKLSFTGATGFRAALAVLLNAGIPTSYQIMGRPPVFKPLNLEIENVTVREALNSIAKADGQFTWMIWHSKVTKGVGFAVDSWRREGVRISDDERKEIQKLYK